MRMFKGLNWMRLILNIIYIINVWMPRLTVSEFKVIERLIGYSHVSCFWCAATLAAGSYEMRGVGPDHLSGLEGRFIILVFPLPIS